MADKPRYGPADRVAAFDEVVHGIAERAGEPSEEPGAPQAVRGTFYVCGAEVALQTPFGDDIGHRGCHDGG